MSLEPAPEKKVPRTVSVTAHGPGEQTTADHLLDSNEMPFIGTPRHEPHFLKLGFFFCSHKRAFFPLIQKRHNTEKSKNRCRGHKTPRRGFASAQGETLAGQALADRETWGYASLEQDTGAF